MRAALSWCSRPRADDGAASYVSHSNFEETVALLHEFREVCACPCAWRGGGLANALLPDRHRAGTHVLHWPIMFDRQQDHQRTAERVSRRRRSRSPTLSRADPCTHTARCSIFGKHNMHVECGYDGLVLELTRTESPASPAL